MSISPVIIPVPIADTDEEDVDLQEYFQGRYDDGSLRAALDLELDDERANVDEVTISDVDVTETGITVCYEISFSAYYGCRDMNYADEDSRHVSGVRVGSDWVFERHVPSPRRYPGEEL